MVYVSIDVETTGLDTQNHQLLSVGAVIEDTNNILPIEELPQIHIAILRENIHGSVFAINLNKKLIEKRVGGWFSWCDSTCVWGVNNV